MHPDSLMAVAAATDSVVVRGVVAKGLAWALASALPGLDAAVSAKLAALLTAPLVVLALALWRNLIKLLTAGTGQAAALWDQHRGWLNPLLAAGLGALTGDWSITGTAAVLLHALQRGVGKAMGKTTPQGLMRGGGTVALILLACGALLTSPGGRVGILARERFSANLGTGVERSFESGRGFDTQGTVKLQVGYGVTDALQLRARGVRLLNERSTWRYEADVWWRLF